MDTKIAQKKKEKLMRDYWLGMLSPQKMEDCELEWYCSDEDSDLLKAVGEEVIEDRLTDSLEAEEKTAFEKFFLSDRRNVEKVAVFDFTRKAVIESSNAQSSFSEKIPVVENLSESSGKTDFWRALKSFFVSPRFALAAFALLIAIGFIGFYVSRKTMPSNEIAQTNAQSPTPNDVNATPNTVAPAVSPAVSVSPNVRVEKSPTPKAAASPTPKDDNLAIPGENKQTVVTLALAAPVRSGGNKAAISIPKNAAGLRLILPMPGLRESYKKYSARLISDNGGQVVRQQRLPNLNNKRSGADVVIIVPAAKLASGDYKIFLIGERADGTSKTLAEPSFTVKKE